MKKRILSAALAVCMLFGSAAALPQGFMGESAGITASAEQEGDYTYSVKSDGTVTITKYNGSGGAITLPQTLGGKTVTEVGSNVFFKLSANKTVTSITVPSTVKQIDASAFRGCQVLTSITLPNSVTSIGNYAFMNCTALTTITIPASVTSLSKSAFDGCTKLTSINVNASNSTYASYDGAVYNKAKTQIICYPQGKTSIELPGTMATVPADVFESGISSVKLNEGTTTIKFWAFIKCGSMKSITIPKSVTSIENQSVGYYHKEDTDPVSKISGFVIYGYTGSAAETYAKNNGITFQSIGTVCQHTYGTPTWTWSGYTSAAAAFTCTKCSTKQTVNATITNAVTKAATCSATGVRTYTATASFGGKSYTNTKTETIAVNSSAHSWKAPTYSWSSDNKTCTATRVCANNANHKETETVTAAVTSTAATCTAAGSTTYTATFKNSAFAKQTKSVSVAALGHSYTTKTVAATCTAQGYTEHKCSRCGNTYNDNYTNALGHNLTTTVVKPTCTAKGYTLHKCTRCSYSFQSDFTDMIDHSWGAWTVTKQPTATTTGTKERTCSVCKKKETATIPVTTHTHSYTTKVVAPTCTAQGYTLHTCSSCGDSYKDTYKNALGHSYSNTVYAPTPIKQGYTLHKCTRAGCGYNYSDNYTAKATIRLSGKNRYETAMNIADQLKKENNNAAFQSIIIASGTSFADALSASYLAKVKNSGNTPILLVANADSIMDSVVAYVKKNAASSATIYLVGGEGVVPKAMVTKLNANGFKNVKRLAGRTRYLTNIEVLKEAGVTNQELLVASGMDYADALSASAVGKPILLVASTGLTAEQQTYLKTLKSTTATIIGGTGAVNTATESQIRALFKSGTRLGGKSRFETSVLVAQKYITKPPAVTLAYGLDYPDGLCGGPLAMKYGCPLILTTSASYTQAKTYAKSIGATSAAVFGGAALINDNAVKNILS